MLTNILAYKSLCVPNTIKIEIILSN
jgi:hypothetical protein